MEGNYSSDGVKNGEFSFYYPNGNLAVKGNYRQNAVFGKWNFYYLSGNPKAEIYFAGSENFTFISYYDSSGNNLMKDGTGYFEWPVYKNYGFNSGRRGRVDFYFKGNFTKGAKDGHWEIFIPKGSDSLHLLFKEDYNNGKFLKGTQYAKLYYDKPYDKPVNLFSMSPSNKFRPTETFACHSVFLHNPADKSGGKVPALQYIGDKTTPTVTIKGSSIDECMNKLTTILSYEAGLTHFIKEYDGDVSFNIGLNGRLSNISFAGNITEEEKLKMNYLLNRVMFDTKKIKTGAFEKLNFIIVIFSMEHSIPTEAGTFTFYTLHFKYSSQKN